MIRTVQLRDLSRSGRLIEALVRQTHGERRQILDSHPLRKHRNEQTRVEATAQECAHRYVADEMQAQRLLDLRLELIQQIVFASCQFWLIAELPVAANHRLRVRLEDEQVRRWQLADALEHRERRCDEPQTEILIERR